MVSLDNQVYRKLETNQPLRETKGFMLWRGEKGILYRDEFTRFPSIVSGFIARSEDRQQTQTHGLSGNLFGFVTNGSLRIQNEKIDWVVRAGQWFSAADSVRISGENCTAVLIERLAYRGLYAMGGPVEPSGRLRYIDGCSDTLLMAPPRIGEPCLNLLHFPAGIHQTPHTHPSSRIGVIISGRGTCHYVDDECELLPGDIFLIPENVEHCFSTQSDEILNVFAYHPDSDWGPTDEEHPMINRTWVNGRKISAPHCGLS